MSNTTHNPGRFDHDKARAVEAGRKGGQNPTNMGRFDNNNERAREAGRKGGAAAQARRREALAKV